MQHACYNTSGRFRKTAVLPTSIPRYVTNGVDIDAHDIETLNVGEMLNDKMVKILMR